MSELTRGAVWRAICGERNYQDRKWGTVEEAPHDLGTWYLLIEAELREVREALVKGGHGRDSARAELVQVAALCVAALEQHGLEAPEGARRGI